MTTIRKKLAFMAGGSGSLQVFSDFEHVLTHTTVGGGTSLHFDCFPVCVVEAFIMSSVLFGVLFCLVVDYFSLLFFFLSFNLCSIQLSCAIFLPYIIFCPPSSSHSSSSLHNPYSIFHSSSLHNILPCLISFPPPHHLFCSAYSRIRRAVRVRTERIIS